MPGRKPKPDHLKVLDGTARKDRMNPSAPVIEVSTAEPPEWLSSRAAELFHQITADLLKLGVCHSVDVYALSMLASRLEEVEICTAIIEDGGRTYEQESGMKRTAPEVGQRNEAMRHAQSLLSEFGLTPAARSKVSVGKQPDENPFKALG